VRPATPCTSEQHFILLSLICTSFSRMWGHMTEMRMLYCSFPSNPADSFDFPDLHEGILKIRSRMHQSMQRLGLAPISKKTAPRQETSLWQIQLSR
jgi:hypothetical protein